MRIVRQFHMVGTESIKSRHRENALQVQLPASEMDNRPLAHPKFQSVHVIVEGTSEVVTPTSAAVEVAVGPRQQGGRTGQVTELRRF
jgi:hypothetical protein